MTKPTPAQYLASLILGLETRATAAGLLTREGLRLSRAAAAYRACPAMRGVWVGEVAS